MLGWSFATPSQAYEPGVALPIYAVPSSAHGASLGERGAEARADVNAPTLPVRRSLELSRVDSRFALLEVPAEASVSGAYKRPHHALGYRWQAAESWLRDHGLDAKTCYLPMMRLHSKISAAGVSGTLWVYGRCTFK